MNISTDGNLPEDVPYVKAGYLYTPPPKTLREATRRIIRRYRRYSAFLYFGWRFYVALAAGKETRGIGDELYEKTNVPDACELAVVLRNYRSYQQFVWGTLNKEIPVVFLYVPLAYVVRPADIIRVKHQGQYKDPLAERRWTRRVQQMLNHNGIHFIDLTDALVQADGKNRMYNLYDIHFTTKGNQVATDTATPIILKIVNHSLMREKKGHT